MAARFETQNKRKKRVACNRIYAVTLHAVASFKHSKNQKSSGFFCRFLQELSRKFAEDFGKTLAMLGFFRYTAKSGRDRLQCKCANL
jgi:hypothetical protein